MTTQQDLISEVEAIQVALKERELTATEVEDVASRLESLKKALQPAGAKLTFRDLKGVGKEYWRTIDVDAYIREERRSWR